MRHPALLMLALLLLCAGCGRSLPATVVGVEEIEAEELARRLRDPRPPLLLDTRDPDSFRRGHLPGALSLRVEEVAGFLRTVPPAGREVVAVCYHGNSSLGVAATAQASWPGRARSLRGGMDRWSRLGLSLERGEGQRLDRERLRPPLVTPGPASRAAFLAVRYLLAPLVLLAASLLLLLRLRRGRAPALAPLRRGLVALLCGSAAGIASDLRGPGVELDLLEGLSGAVAVALVGLGLLRLLETHAQRSAERAPALGRRLLLALGPALALLALLPWAAPIRRLDLRLALPAGELYWFRNVEVQVVELRLYPLIAAALLLFATGALLRARRPPARGPAPFFVGLGFLLASARATLLALFQAQPIWARFCKVSAELLAILLLALLLARLRGALGIPTSARGVDARRRGSL